MKDYLQEQGFNEMKSPRDTIKKAFEIDLIENGHVWLSALEDRNKSAHIYDEQKANEIYELILKKYFQILRNLCSTLKQKI